jgi:hypothetical protein
VAEVVKEEEVTWTLGAGTGTTQPEVAGVAEGEEGMASTAMTTMAEVAEAMLEAAGAEEEEVNTLVEAVDIGETTAKTTLAEDAEEEVEAAWIAAEAVVGEGEPIDSTAVKTVRQGPNRTVRKRKRPTSCLTTASPQASTLTNTIISSAKCPEKTLPTR